MTFARRRHFDHSTPYWIQGHRRFFITICATPRHTNQLCDHTVADVIFRSAEFYQQRGRWHVELLLLMPDHLHALVAFPTAESMPKLIRAWKHYLASNCGVVWQRDFFDHRIRDKKGHLEKADYILKNPVRAGLVNLPAEWPFVWSPSARMNT